MKLRTHKKNAQNIQYYFSYVSKLVLAVVMSFPVVFILLLLIHALIPKNAWLNLHSTPYDYHLYAASDISYGVTTDELMFFYNGAVSLSDINYLSINGQDLYADISDDYCIVFEYTDLKDDIPCIMSFDSTVFFENDTIIYPNCYPTGNVYLTNNGMEYIEENGEMKEIHTNTFTVTKDTTSIGMVTEDYLFEEHYGSKDYFYSCIFLDNPTIVYISGDFAIYRNNECIATSEENDFVVLGTDTNTVFRAAYEGVTTFAAWDSSLINVLAYCESFNEQSIGADDVLLYTHMDEQTEYNINSVAVEAESVKDSLFNVDFNMSGGSTDLKITGNAKNVVVAGNAFQYTLPKFVKDNLGEIIISIITAVIGTFFALVKKGKEPENKEDNKSNNETDSQ